MIGPKGSQRKLQNAAGLKPHLVTLDNQHLQLAAVMEKKGWNSWGFNKTDGDSWTDVCDTLKIRVVTKVDMAKVCQSMPNFKLKLSILDILVWEPLQFPPRPLRNETKATHPAVPHGSGRSSPAPAADLKAMTHLGNRCLEGFFICGKKDFFVCYPSNVWGIQSRTTAMSQVKICVNCNSFVFC